MGPVYTLSGVVLGAVLVHLGMWLNERSHK